MIYFWKFQFFFCKLKYESKNFNSPKYDNSQKNKTFPDCLQSLSKIPVFSFPGWSQVSVPVFPFLDCLFCDCLLSSFFCLQIYLFSLFHFFKIFDYKRFSQIFFFKLLEFWFLFLEMKVGSLFKISLFFSLLFVNFFLWKFSKFYFSRKRKRN